MWKEFELGTQYTNAASAFKVLEAQHVDVTRAAKEKLRQKMSKVVQPRTLAIAQITVSELGFMGKPFLSEILERAKALRLREVPFDAMPLVAMEYTGNRNLFFGTRVLGGENEDRLAMVVSDSEYEGEVSLLRTASQKSEWTNELLRFPFERGAIFLFVLPD